MAWYTSDRRERLPDDWPQLREAVRDRAGGRCEASPHALGCDRIGSECDHVIEGDNHSLDNLAWLSKSCHKAKTARDAARRNHARAMMRRRREDHPGRL